MLSMLETSSRLYIFLIKRCSFSITKSYYVFLLSSLVLCEPSISSKKPHIHHIVLEGSMIFSFTNIDFCMSFSSKNLDLMVFLNHNLSSTGKSSGSNVDFSRERTKVAASINWLKITLLKQEFVPAKNNLGRKFLLCCAENF